MKKKHPYWFLIYGFNITILAGLFSRIFGRLLGSWRGALAAGTGATIFTLVIGAGPSVVLARLDALRLAQQAALVPMRS